MKNSNHLFTYVYKDKLSLPVADIYQLTELSILHGTEISEHIQYCDEITYAISGKATMYTGNEVQEISKGQVHFVKKGTSHRICACDDSNFRYICIGYTPKDDYTPIKEIVNTLSTAKTFVATDSGNIRILSEMLINESYSRDKYNDIMINSYMVQIITEMLRLLEGVSKSSENKYQSTYSGLAIYHALRYIDRNFLEIKSVKEISEKLSYSEYYLSHIFKEKLGMSIKQYITEKKISEACNLLKTSNLSIGEISEKLGYSNAHSFSINFKKITGLSPTEYKSEKN